MKLGDIIAGAFVFIVAAALFLSIIILSVEEADKVPTDCTKEISVKYRFVTSGGFFGGVEEKIVTGNNYDGYKDVCVEGKNWKGKHVEQYPDGYKLSQNSGSTTTGGER